MDIGLEFPELGEGDGALHLRNPVIQRHEIMVGLRVPVAPGLVHDKPDPSSVIVVVRDDDPIVVQCLGGFLKMADDALDAAVSCLDD